MIFVSDLDLPHKNDGKNLEQNYSPQGIVVGWRTSSQAARLASNPNAGRASDSLSRVCQYTLLTWDAIMNCAAIIYRDPLVDISKGYHLTSRQTVNWKAVKMEKWRIKTEPSSSAMPNDMTFSGSITY
jgi:hypothetical protein